MDPVFRYRPKQPVRWYSRDLHETNQHCLYCGAFVGHGSVVASDKEHMLARNFVPRGSLDGTAFNFIFRACVACNQRKAEAERHVSAVTLFTSPSRATDAEVNARAIEKAEHDYHPSLRGKLVKDATLTWNLRSKFAGGEMTAQMIGPPQLAKPYLELLACNQVQAMFALTATSDPRRSESTRLLPASHWRVFDSYPFRDWGNRKLAEIQKRVQDWPVLAGIVTANGFFKFIARQRDEPGSEWFWAMEWNKSVRVVGAICLPDCGPLLFDDLPEHAWIPLSKTTRMRQEIAGCDGADVLFRWE